MLTRDYRRWAYIMDMGTGKSKLTIDVAGYSFLMRRITGVLVLAPNGVHTQWVDEQLPEHMSDDVSYYAVAWTGDKTKKHQRELDKLFDAGVNGQLAVLCVNIEALSSSKRAKDFVKRFVNAFRTMLVVDESTRIKNPSAKVTRFVTGTAKNCTMIRTLSGWPLAQSPLDAYVPYRMLDSTIWDGATFTGFRHRYADVVQQLNRQATEKRGKEVYYDIITGYRNMDELAERIGKISYRVQLEECTDLPPVVYKTRYIPLTEKQATLYKQMLDDACVTVALQVQQEAPHVTIPERGTMSDEEYFLWLLDSNDTKTVVAQSGGVKYTKLRQIIGGNINLNEGTDPEPDWQCIEPNNPRLADLLEYTETMTHPCIIWAKYRIEIDQVCRALREKYGEDSVLEYHGGVSKKQRDINKVEFQTGKYKFFVGNEASGGIGLQLTAARYMVYYTHSDSIEDRKQSERRARRIGQTGTLVITDYMAKSTIEHRKYEQHKETANMLEDILDKAQKVNDEQGIRSTEPC